MAVLFVLCSSCTGWHTYVYTNSFLVCLSCALVNDCLCDWLDCLIDWLIGGWVDEWLDGRMTNWALCTLWIKWDVFSITQNAWPAYSLAWHVNCQEQQNKISAILIITNSNVISLLKVAAERKNAEQFHKYSVRVNFTLLHFYHKLSCFTEV